MVELPTADNIVFDSVFTPSVFTSTVGLVFNDEGTAMYIGAGSNYIRSFTLSTAWDITSATENAGITLGGTGTAALTWGDGGMKLYGGSTVGDTIVEWNLDAPYDILSAAGRAPVNSVGLFEPLDLAFNFDGTKLYISSNDASAIVTIWDLSTAWDISNKTSTSNAMTAPIDTAARGIVVSGDGTRLWQSPLNQNFVYSWDLATANDISTVSYTSADDGVLTDATTSPYVMYVPVGRNELYVGWSGARSIQKYTWA